MQIFSTQLFAAEQANMWQFYTIGCYENLIHQIGCSLETVQLAYFSSDPAYIEVVPISAA